MVEIQLMLKKITGHSADGSELFELKKRTLMALKSNVDAQRNATEFGNINTSDFAFYVSNFNLNGFNPETIKYKNNIYNVVSYRVLYNNLVIFTKSGGVA